MGADCARRSFQGVSGILDFDSILLCHGGTDCARHVRTAIEEYSTQAPQEFPVITGARQRLCDVQHVVRLCHIASLIALTRTASVRREKIQQVIGINWLGKIGVHSGREATFAVPSHSMSSQRDDGDMRAVEALRLADFCSGFEAVHAGHLYVHEYYIEMP